MTDVIYTVAASVDDGKCDQADGTNYNRTADFIGFGDDSGVTGYHNWARFDNVAIPSGVEITSAVLRCIARDSRSGTTVNVTIHCEDADDPTYPTNGSDVIGRSLTSGTDWNNLSAWVGGDEYDSVDFSSELQTVIDRPGWNSGQAVIVNVLDNGSSVLQLRTCASWNHTTLNPPKLVVTYSDAILASTVDSASVSVTADAEYPLIAETTDSASSRDTVDALNTTSETSDSASVSITADAESELQGATTDSASVQDTAEGYIEAVATGDNSASVSVSSDAFNYSRWLRENADKAKQRFFFTLTGAANGTTDVELPVSNAYATRPNELPEYLQVVLPFFSSSLDVSLRPNGEMILEIGYEVDGEISSELRERLIIADLDDITTYEGGQNRSILLTGRRTTLYGKNEITLDEAELIYRAVDTGARIFRFSKIHPFLNPGDTVIIRDFTEDDKQEAFTCNRIHYTITEHNSIMELREAL